jgi:GH15 family glucan-1,4-alpha-glucosidase
VREGASRLQSVYGLSGERDLEERDLPDGTSWGPIRIGNLAHRQSQHDVYGSVILACARAFHDERFERAGDVSLFQRLEALGERAVPLFDRHDAGPFESRAKPRRYTHSAAMCWAACDRLARIAQRLSLADRAGYWKKRADFLRVQILSRIWRESRGCFSAVMDEDCVDASLLHLPELGLVSCRDPQWVATLDVIERELRNGDFLMRSRPGTGEEPEQLYTLCSLWWANAQAAVGRYDQARETFEKVLQGRNGLGLLSERIDGRTGRLWGNFPHTAAMAAIITTAARLSRDWDAGS